MRAQLELLAERLALRKARLCQFDHLAGIVAQATATEPPPPPPEGTRVTRQPAPEEREQVRAARQWLKNQYLQRAHSHVVKKQFVVRVGDGPEAKFFGPFPLE